MSASLNRIWLGGLGIGLLTIGIIAVLPVAADDDDEDDAGEVEISVEDLPEAIREALEGVEIDDVDRVTFRDRVIYEVAIELDDAEIELQLTNDARLVGVEIEDEGDDSEDGDEEEEDESEDSEDDDAEEDDDE